MRGRLFRVLLRVLPAEHRAGFGEEIEQVFRAQLRDARGPAAAAAVCLETTAGLVRTALAWHLDTAARDLRYALRSLARSPGLAASAVLTLGLAIGVNTALYGWVRALLLDPLPAVERPERLVLVYETATGGRDGASGISLPNLRDYQARVRSLDGLLGYENASVHLTAAGETRRVDAAIVTGNYFDVLGVRAALGRTFAPAEDAPGATPVCVVADATWRARFGADPGVVGREVRLNGHAFTVVGIAPAGFRGATVGQDYDLWVPSASQPLVVPGIDRLDARDARWLDVVGRLAEGAGVEQARAELGRIAADLEREFPRVNDGRTVTADAPGEAPVGVVSAVAPALEVLSVLVALVLVVACSNLASLLLARGVTRGREIAVRLSLGASRRRLVRQLLTESLVLALLAGVCGLLLGHLSNLALLSLAPPLPQLESLSLGLDRSVLLVALALSAASALLFGLVPALQATRPELLPSLRDGRGEGRRASRLRSGLVLAQVSFSTVALVAAVLLFGALSRARSTDPGFRSEGLTLASLDVFPTGMSPDEGRLFYRRLLDEVRGLPGVTSSSLARRPPLMMRGPRGTWIEEIEGYEASPEERLGSLIDAVGPGYFTTLGAPLLAGRDIGERDGTGAPRVVVVNESFARRYWPDGAALGRRIRMRGAWHRIVGVARDLKHRGLLERGYPYLFVAQQQHYEPDMTLLVRSEASREVLVPALRARVERLQPELPVYDVVSMEDRVAGALAMPRLASASAGFFGLLALGMAALGLHGIVAQYVATSRRSIGIRMAVGARPGGVLSLVCGRALRLTAWGLVLGVPLALGASGIVRGAVAGVTEPTAGQVAVVGLVLLAAALLASLGPAWRATRIDPVATLRAD